ncbi:V4R domain-containing protein [Palaeococcus sp. (in: euryarchaeotes)]|uniref:V4R domain-containing protein n=1 Tax=Palaeococcus sp. (in: euryarchaeotes) TaxID=2820298 RepID=UPI000F0D4D22|nr:V4R domain-containing protein [Palaeococcus sp. (in: euryarchaeotes)]MCD6558260.1 hypothetical protein [Palaeococcus sp. (in: euryarchaeotes)]RLF77447.1 MAG: hypothetical protein DRN39_04070 [Thermococci archaeon]
MESEYLTLIEKWREIYKTEVRNRKRMPEVAQLNPEEYLNVRRPFFTHISPEDAEYVRTFRMVSYGMLSYSPSLRAVILRGAGYNLARRLTGTGEIKSVDDLPRVFLKQRIGLLDIIDESFNKMKINIYECISCYQSPPIGRTLCDFEAGMIQGAIESLIGKNITREIYCWGLGNSFCGFEIVFE